MADGVDHIDIYADVGEEFNQGPLQRALPRRLGGRDPPGCGGESGPFPPAAEGKRCHCSQMNQKAAERWLFLGRTLRGRRN